MMCASNKRKSFLKFVGFLFMRNKCRRKYRINGIDIMAGHTVDEYFRKLDCFTNMTR